MEEHRASSFGEGPNMPFSNTILMVSIDTAEGHLLFLLSTAITEVLGGKGTIICLVI
jgi:hypothetical protein